MLALLQGYLSVNYSDNYYFLSQRHDEVPRLTPAHLEVRRMTWRRVARVRDVLQVFGVPAGLSCIVSVCSPSLLVPSASTFQPESHT